MKFVKVNKFSNKGLIINAETQLVNSENLGFYEGEGQLLFSPKNQIISTDSRNLSVYFADYDFKNIQRGFVFEKEFTYFFTNFQFNTYYDKDNDIFMLAVKKKVAKSFLSELVREKKGGQSLFSFSDIVVDFETIVAKADNLSGVWAQVQRENVHSQAFYGENVNQDSEVKLILAEKKTSYVLFDAEVNGNHHKIGITKEGNVIVHTLPSNEDELVKIGFLIYDRFLS